jgi:hypothetical protein
LTSLTNTKSLISIFLTSLTIGLALVFSSCAGQAMGQGAAQVPPSKPDKAAVTTDQVSYKIIPITMEMEAGAAQYKQWPGGKKTIHAGIGWIEPFGRSEYVAGMGYPEAEKYPKPSYFNDEWMKNYGTDLFCIYMLKDGNIYAWDGITGRLEPEVPEDDGRMDYLINVIVGGTGAYEGATGMLLGATPGRGKQAQVSEGVSLPVSILKLMKGYIKLPVKK